MHNQSILQRLSTFQKEIEVFQAKTAPVKDYSVNEIRFICERSILLMKNYSGQGSELPKEIALAKLLSVLETIEDYYIAYNKSNSKATVPTIHITEPALEALSSFLISISQVPVKSKNIIG
ncbi:hypothetical protein ACFPQ1_29820 [Rhodocytophaga aerolata]|uniref:hypothetical protein n=1 Tax=Rhodocytophaga aerolata TaxID=455078 RepID=UPI003605B021